MDLIGKSPVPVPALLIGKIAFVGCAFFFLVKLLNIDTMLYDSALTQGLGAVVYFIGLIVVITSLVQLGRSVAVGIPDRNTELKTHGLYRLTRNPIYLGGFVMCAGSCLFSIHLINVILGAVAIAVHHCIVVQEELFLEKRFGSQWLEYKQQVPRYIGKIKRS